MVNVNFKVPFVICTVFFLSTFNGLVQAADGAELYKTKTCNACHGVDANTPLLPVYPKLAGQNSEYLVNQMRDIKRSLARDSPRAEIRSREWGFRSGSAHSWSMSGWGEARGSI
ncbi:MAG: c-type cytochrome, partial [Gammaproteobacteria bacterium]